jgi:hypothetical protein
MIRESFNARLKKRVMPKEIPERIKVIKHPF